METKHTPGPWHLVIRGVGPHEIHDRETHFDVDGARVGETANGIAYVERYPGMRGKGEANARLIAAAPDLLDVLEAIEEECASYFDFGDMREGAEVIDDMRPQIRAAIAKARGES